MSFILDALRKSEAARRRSEAPDLFATMPQAAEPPRMRRAWPLWTIAGIGVLSLIVAIWLVSRPPATPVAAPDSPRVDDAETPTIEAPLTSAAPIAAAPVVEQAASSAPPAATPTPMESAPLESAPERALPVKPLPPASTPIATSSTTPIGAPQTLPTPPASLPATPPASDQPIALADLDPATRKQLPPLKLSMHLWNETPSGRFVILDGQRLKEGDVLGEVVIERITRDGAVLVWRGGRLKIALQ